MSSRGQQPGRGRRTGCLDDSVCPLGPGQPGRRPRGVREADGGERTHLLVAPVPPPRGTRTGPGPERAPAPDGAAARAESEAVWALCATLPDKQRAAVVLRFYEELSYAEIGALLHCAEATADRSASSTRRTEDHAEQGRSRGCLSTTLSRSSAPRSFGVPEQGRHGRRAAGRGMAIEAGDASQTAAVADHGRSGCPGRVAIGGGWSARTWRSQVASTAGGRGRSRRARALRTRRPERASAEAAGRPVRSITRFSS